MATETSTTPAPPTGLGAKARKIWVETVEVYDLRIDELRILEDACREVDLVERMEEQLRPPKKGETKHTAALVVPGSQGQPVASPLVQEIRQHRAIVKSLLAALKLPDEPGEPVENPRSVSARAAAEARWRKGA